MSITEWVYMNGYTPNKTDTDSEAVFPNTVSDVPIFKIWVGSPHQKQFSVGSSAFFCVREINVFVVFVDKW